MKTTLLLSIFLASSMLVTAASALTIVNRDTDEHQITIVEGGDEQIFILAPDESIDEVCLTVCTVAPGEEAPAEFGGDGVVAIVDGKLVRE